MAMTKKDELQQTNSISSSNSSSNSSSMNLFQEVEHKQENKGTKRSRYF